MFGFSIGKLLVLAAVVAAVWFAVRYFADAPKRRQAAARQTAKQVEAEDMVACPRCGTYVATRHARRCGRTECPYPG